MNICDQYDAPRSERPYKQTYDHKKSCSIILQGSERTSPEYFDPEILEAFRKSCGRFTKIYDELKA